MPLSCEHTLPSPACSRRWLIPDTTRWASGARDSGLGARTPAFQLQFHQYVAYRQAVRIMKKLSEPLYWQGVPGVRFLGAPSAFSSNLGGTASSLEPSAAMFNSMQLPTTQR